MVVFYVSGRSGLEKIKKNTSGIDKIIVLIKSTVVLSAEPVFIHTGFRKQDPFL
jgi:hypothetical protein